MRNIDSFRMRHPLVVPALNAPMQYYGTQMPMAILVGQELIGSCRLLEAVSPKTQLVKMSPMNFETFVAIVILSHVPNLIISMYSHSESIIMER
jgi:hypothetical protein